MVERPELPSKQELLTFFRELKSAAKAYREALAKVAYYGWRIKENESWTDLGYEDEEAMRAAIDIPDSTWYKYTRIGGILRHLSLAQLEAIKPRNLDLLCQVPSELWPEHDWVGEARSLEPDALCELITARNRAHGNGREPMTVYRESVPFSSQQMIKECVKAFQEKHELASPGRALELMIADQFDRTSYLASIIKIRRMLAAFRETLKAAQCSCGCSRPFLDLAIYNELDDIRIYAGEVCKEALEKARQGKINTSRRPGADDSAAEPGGSDGVEEAEVGRVEESTGVVQSMRQPDETERRPSV